MNPKQRKRLKKVIKQHKQVKTNNYISELTHYRDLFDFFPAIKYLINNVLESNRLLQNGLLPQPLPKLLLPDNIQDTIFNAIQSKYAPDDPAGDQQWSLYVDALPKLDRLLRNYRDYLETTYGMWSYTNSLFVKQLSQLTDGQPVLEVMAGNGYISKGLKNLNSQQIVITTDSQAWTTENETGKHPVTTIESLDALSAFDKYESQIKYVIMSWAPDKQTTDWELLQKIRNSARNIKLLVIGEQNGATNSSAFWNNVEIIPNSTIDQINTQFKSFDLINEKLFECA
ncbi:SAM-dependent methyltransferase [Paucilactobacillus kaifaensis]|uniref:SAM-dependent methyltransferase n=1 Tax=Paucilactobacillus kaifaensis TaxID=2559921 RepID=UPI0010F94B08|nr:SAM-dependent methyltransferase [Paucilactobacillus kaifaensis]